MNHEFFMEIALKEALKSQGFTKPNPLVGAVLVENNKLIAKARHEYFGEGHAEYNLLKNRSINKDMILYCTLEPCCHTKKLTPPCVPLIIQSGIRKVVIGNLDPNPNVSGKGVQQLKDAGIEVTTGVLEKKVRQINQIFFKVMTSELPYLHAKFAQTLDGKLSLNNGQSQWITSPETKAEVHRLRALHDAILVSGKTFRNDQPKLNVRTSPYQDHPKFKQPKPIIVSKSPLNLDSNYICQDSELKNKNDWLNFFKKSKTHFHINSIFIEPGPGLLGELMKHDLLDRITLFIAPSFMGQGKTLDGFSLDSMSELKRYTNFEMQITKGSDIQIDIYLKDY